MPALFIIGSYLLLLLVAGAVGDYMGEYRWFVYTWLGINVGFLGLGLYLKLTHREAPVRIFRYRSGKKKG